LLAVSGSEEDANQFDWIFEWEERADLYAGPVGAAAVCAGLCHWNPGTVP